MGSALIGNRQSNIIDAGHRHGTARHSAALTGLFVRATPVMFGATQTIGRKFHQETGCRRFMPRRTYVSDHRSLINCVQHRMDMVSACREGRAQRRGIQQRDEEQAGEDNSETHCDKPLPFGMGRTLQSA